MFSILCYTKIGELDVPSFPVFSLAFFLRNELRPPSIIAYFYSKLKQTQAEKIALFSSYVYNMSKRSLFYCINVKRCSVEAILKEEESIINL